MASQTDCSFALADDAFCRLGNVCFQSLPPLLLPLLQPNSAKTKEIEILHYLFGDYDQVRLRGERGGGLLCVGGVNRGRTTWTYSDSIVFLSSS